MTVIGNSLGNIDLTQQLKAFTLDEAGDSASLKPESGELLGDFGQVLKQHLNEVNQLKQVADKAVQTYAVGGNIELHNVMLATEKASLALQLTTQIRNKLVAAYQEVSRMQV